MPRRPSSDSRTPFDPPDFDDFADVPLTRSGTRTLKRPNANRLSAASLVSSSADVPAGNLRRRLAGDSVASPARVNSSAAPLKGNTLKSGKKSDTLSLFDVASDGSTTRRRKGASPPPPTLSQRAMWREIAGVFCIALGLILLLNVLQRDSESLMARVREGLSWVLGVGAFAVPVALVVMGTLLVVGRGRANLHAFARGLVAAFAVGLTWVHLGIPHGKEFFDVGALREHGGVFGASLAWCLRSAFGESGVRVVLVAASVVCLLLWTELSLNTLVARALSLVQRAWNYIATPQASASDDLATSPLASNSSAVPTRAPRKSFFPSLPSSFSRKEETENEELDDEEDAYNAEDEDPHVTNAVDWDSTPVRAAPPKAASARAPRIATAPKSTVLPRLPNEDDLLDDDSDSIVELHSAHHSSPERGPSPVSESGIDPNPLQALRKGANASPTLATPLIPAPRVEIAHVTPPPSVLDMPPDMLPSSNDDEVHTPAELLEAQAQASASEGGAVPGSSLKPTKACRAFGAAVMPPYFDEAVRAFDAPVTADITGVEDDIAEGVAAVQETLGAFKVDARVTDVKRGPVITRYEVQPAPGVRVAAIANLDKDLARSMSALAVRIEAPVPGKNVVGIEVPNKRVHLVRLRDVLELPEFLAAPSKLSFVLGRDIAGQPKWADLTKMPHLLIAGATNSGKSVCLNSIIASILCRATPDEVKFSLIDPKRVELTLFRDIKHLYHPVVVEPKDAVRALRGAIAEMDRRYRRFSARGVRNIASYNSKLDPDEQPLPYLVIVIDELADLMMTAAAEFEKLICRLAQLARATGIHLIVATQRPSVNVITGVIKANIPARIAFAVASQVDSRTILDSVGAERLIGSGDMLFDANNGGKALRIQGAYLSEEEVNRLVTSVKESYQYDDRPLDYGMDLNLVADDEGMGGGTSLDEPVEKRDDLYDDIREFVVRHQEMSASMIQRKFEIGYPRAGRIMDQLERDGVVGPADGPKPRKVLGS